MEKRVRERKTERRGKGGRRAHLPKKICKHWAVTKRIAYTISCYSVR